MSARKDTIQFTLEFVNEESKSLGRQIIDAKKLNEEIDKLTKNEKKLANEREQLIKKGEDTLELDKKRISIQDEIKAKLNEISKVGKNIETLDLSKVAPAQLISAAKEMKTRLEFLGPATEQGEALQKALKRVNDQIADNNAATKGTVTKELTEQMQLEQRKADAQEKAKENLKEILKTSNAIERIDFSNLTPVELETFAKSLKDELHFLNPATEQAKVLERALKNVNTQISQNAERTRSVNNNLQDTQKEASKLQQIFILAFGINIANIFENFVSNLKQIGVQLYERSKQIEFFGSKHKFVFGEASRDMERYAESMTTLVGQSTSDVMKDITQMSNIFKTLEFNNKYLPQLTKELYNITAAWSLYNGGQYTVMEVSEKLQKALGGEVDELTELGIGITEDTIKKELQVKKYNKLTGAAYDQAYALSLLEVISRKTSEAQQILGQNSEQLGAKQNILKAYFQTLYDSIAKSLNSLFKFGTSFLANIVDPLNAAKSEYDAQAAKVELLNGRLTTLLNRYDELKAKASLSTIEQKELKDVIQKISEIAPSAALGFDEYGKALDISTQKAKAFMETERYRLKYMNEERIKQLEQEEKILEFQHSVEMRFLNDPNMKTTKDHFFVFSRTDQDIRNAQNEVNKIAERMKGLKAELSRLKGDFVLPEETKKQEIKIDTKIDPDKAKQDAEKKKRELEEKKKEELEKAKAATERELIILEKHRIRKEIDEQTYFKNLEQIHLKGYDNQLKIYQKYKEGHSLEAEKIRKEKIELETNTADKLLQLQLQKSDEEEIILKQNAEKVFLEKVTKDNITKKQFEQAEREYKRRLLDIEAQTLNEKLGIIERANQKEKAIYLDLQVKNLQNTFKKQEEVQKERDAEEKVKSDKIAADIAAMEEQNAIEEGILRKKFAAQILTEQEFGIKKLEFHRALIADKIAILESGGEREKAQARKLGDELAATEAEIEAKKIENKRRTQEVEQALLQEKTNWAKDGLAIAIDLLSQDEKSRKKHAEIIKAFEVGQVWANLYSEISRIWYNAQFNPIAKLIPGGAETLASVQTAFATVRAGVQTSKIMRTKFAEGGFTSAIGDKDETGEQVAGLAHAGEWYAPRRMVQSNPSFFKLLDNMRINSITPTANALAPKMNIVYVQQQGNDNTLILRQFAKYHAEVSAWRRELKVNFVYQDYQDFDNSIKADFEANNW